MMGKERETDGGGGGTEAGRERRGWRPNIITIKTKTKRTWDFFVFFSPFQKKGVFF